MLALFLVGVPLLLLEIAFGQVYRSGNVVAFGRVNARFRGLGVASILNAFVVATYYNVIIAWILIYFGRSFTADLPFKEAPEAFFDKVKANVGTTWESSDGGIIWLTWGMCTLTWVIVYLCVFRGVNVLGKIVYFTMGFPIIALVVILVRGVTLENALQGIRYYVGTWRGDTLGDAKVWQDAVGQIFFSIGCSFGAFTAYSSYNPRLQNCVSDTWIIALSNSLFEVIAGFAAFGVAGFLNLNPNGVDLGTYSLGFLTYTLSSPFTLYVVIPQLWHKSLAHPSGQSFSS